MSERYCEKCNALRYGNAKYCIGGGKNIEPDVYKMFEDILGKDAVEDMFKDVK